MTVEDGFTNIGSRKFGNDTCFLCRCLLTKENRTAEHVIPRWVQSEFGLWNETLILLNGTVIPYRKLMIPCCFECNNRHLEPLESRVHDAVMDGPDAVESLGKEVLFLWLGKIFFGLLYKESLIPFDRRDPDLGNIMPLIDLDRFFLHHVFLQNARFHFRWQEAFPASIFVYPIQATGDPKAMFDIQDNFAAMTIALRLGKVGIVAALQDSEAMRIGYAEEFGRYQSLTLHPLQFDEIAARLFYKVYLMEKSPFYIIAEQPDQYIVHQQPFHPTFREWNIEEYARLFARLSGLPLETIDKSTGLVTFLDDESGEPRPWN